MVRRKGEIIGITNLEKIKKVTPRLVALGALGLHSVDVSHDIKDMVELI